MSEDRIAERYHQLETRIAAACAACGRNRSDIRVIWVSKTRPVADVEEAILAGAREFGENRVQEALDKFLPERPNVRCHIIGPVQSNKLRKAVSVAHSIDSVSSLDDVIRLEKLCEEQDRRLDVLFQINTSCEDSKSGIAMEDCAAFLDGLPLANRLSYKGLMTIGKNTGNPEDSRTGFAWLRDVRDRYTRRDERFAHFSELSMGMTDDLEVAVAEGATALRIGTYLFGNRTYAH